MLVLTLVTFFFAICSAVSFFPERLLVVDITPENVDQIENSDNIWLVHFHSETSKSVLPELEDTAARLRGVARVATVDATKYPELAEKYNIKKFPTLKIFSSHVGKPETYAGEFTSNKLVNHILGVVKRKVLNQSETDFRSHVIELDDTNFDESVLRSKEPWLVEFYVNYCPHCRAFKPIWKEAAEELQGKVKVGAVDCKSNQNKASEYNIEAYPTIKFFPPGKQAKDNLLDYDGERSSSAIVEWVSGKLSEKSSEPEIIQITDEKSLKRACETAPLCVVSFLPHIRDCNAQCRKEYLTTLQNANSEYNGYSWGWVWTEGGAQKGIEKALDIGGSGYPVMAIVNIKKMIYSVLKGSFSLEGINEFIEQVLSGKGDASPIGKYAKLPKINAVEAWDGGDADVQEEGAGDFRIGEEKCVGEGLGLEDSCVKNEV